MVCKLIAPNVVKIELVTLINLQAEILWNILTNMPIWNQAMKTWILQGNPKWMNTEYNIADSILMS